MTKFLNLKSLSKQQPSSPSESPSETQHPLLSTLQSPSHKQFPPQFLSQVEEHLKKNSSSKLIAAFDADGTLWDTDLGEVFFHDLISFKKVSLPPNPWEYYQALKKENPTQAYYWLAQILKGIPLKQVQEWASDSIKKLNPLPILNEQKHFISLLQAYNVKIFVVTASVKWAVEPGAYILGIPSSQVLGIETLVTPEGIVTDQPLLPATYKEGKALALLKKTKGVQPFLACGNSTGDTDLLKIASIKLAVRSSQQKNPTLAQAEQELYDLAREQGWFSYAF
jgi:phosphoserine phosphatase